MTRSARSSAPAGPCRPRARLGPLAAPLLALLALLLGPAGPGCSGRHVEGDADADADADGDGDGDTGPSDPRECGNGVVDEGEECDDRNRLDGDGCDWLCRLGDGEPPAEPDPGFAPYEPEGPAAPLEVGPPFMSCGFDRLPLVWTGSELAVAHYGEVGSDGSRVVLFHRLDERGARLDSEWEVPVVQMPGGLDLVWTGEAFALFHGQLWEGVYVTLLDRVGKPLSGPFRVVDDHCVLALAADAADSGLALAWGVMDHGATEESGCRGEEPNPAAGAHMGLVGHDGSTVGAPAPLLVAAGLAWYPDVAFGSPGLCVVVDGWLEAEGEEVVSFVLVDEAGAEASRPRLLGPGGGSAASVVFGDGRYWVAWAHKEESDPPGLLVADNVCVARLSLEGLLEGPPACAAPPGYRYFTSPLIAFGDGGLGLVVAAEGALLFLRTDGAGVAVAAAREVDPFPGPEGYAHGPYGVVWTGSAFVVVYAAGMEEPLRLRRFVEVAP